MFGLTPISASPVAGEQAVAALAAGPSARTLTSQAASLLAARRLNAAAAAYTATGQPAALSVGRRLSAGPAAYTIAGQAATFSTGGRLNAGPAAYTLAGQAASLLVSRVLSGAPAAYTIASQAAGLNRSWSLAAAPAAYALTGKSASLTWSYVGGVRKFVLPDHTTKAADQAGFEDYAREIEASLSVLFEALGPFAPYAATPPDMTVTVGPGRFTHQFGLDSNATTLVGKAAQTTPSLAVPAAGPRIDRIGIQAVTGDLVLVTGIETASPVAPAYPDGVLPVCRVELALGQTAITNAHIFDERGQAACKPAASPAGAASTIYGVSAGYAIYETAGTYNFTKPAGANSYRITVVGAGGGGGGQWSNAAYTVGASGGGGGGGAILPNALMAAEDLTIVIGAGGAGGAGSSGGANNAVNGGSGGQTAITGASSGTVLIANGGAGGGRGTSTPAGGTAGTGGAAPTGGFAGGPGAAGLVGIGEWGGFGGGVGEQLQLRPFGGAATCGSGAVGGPFGSGLYAGGSGTDGWVLIEWF